MKKILIISENQFGYLMDTYYMCKYLKSKLDITIICEDNGKLKREMSNIKVIYKKLGNNFLFKHLKLVYECYKFCKRRNDIDIILIDRFRFCFFLLFFIKKEKVILDIRTVSISKNKVKQFLNDLELIISAKFFKYVSVIDKNIASKLRLKKYFILPLGAEEIITRENNDKKFFNLFYIGTLNLREISKTIEGFGLFLKKYKINSIYYIVGDGSKEEIEKIKKAIIQNNLIENVIFLGRKEHEELKEIYMKTSVGISFIPKTAYFNYQPPTKTFEYLVNGLICLATNTQANKNIIDEETGVLCDDNPKDFFIKLEKIYLNFSNYQLKKIQDKSKKYLWSYIVKEYYEVLFLKKIF